MTSPRFPAPSRMVVKVGSSSLRADDGGLDAGAVDAIVDQIAGLVGDGVQVVLVSSGAVAAGLRPLGLVRRPTDTPTLQAAASVGQGALMHAYQAAFARHRLACGQILLTPDDVVERVRYLNARHTFDTLLGLGAVPVVNENDSVATDELRFGDNDRLAALVASMLGAGLLLLLSDVEGVYPGDPRREAGLEIVDRVDEPEELAQHVGGVGSDVGSGGMASKLEAARIARFSGAHAVIARARRSGVVREVHAGGAVGTWFPPARRRPESRKLWIAFARTPRGTLRVDGGAVRALVERGSSLLPAGVVAAEGAFRAGDAVDVCGPDGRLVARGLASYDRDAVDKQLGRTTAEITAVHGPGYDRPVIHRDSLVVVA